MTQAIKVIETGVDYILIIGAAHVFVMCAMLVMLALLLFSYR